jgi:hypothetical protein
MTATGTVHFDNAHPTPTDRGELGPISVPFTKVPTAVVRGHALGLSPWAKLLYVALCSYADPAGACYPGYATLRADVGCGLNQLTRAMRELEAAGLVTRRRRGQGHPTHYTLHAPAISPAVPVLIHSQSESRVTPTGKLESPPRGVEQDSGDQDPDEHHQPVPPVRLAPTASDADGTIGAGDDAALLATLIAHGITPRIAQGLLASSPPAAIREQLAWQAQRPAATNPAGALVQAIRERWPAPPGAAAAQARTAAAQRQAKDARRHEQEAAARRREWAARPPEERIAGRLTFWIQGRRAKRHEPTAAEIAGRKAELLAELAAGDGVS